jgi:hypothetical protein
MKVYCPSGSRKKLRIILEMYVYSYVAGKVKRIVGMIL